MFPTAVPWGGIKRQNIGIKCDFYIYNDAEAFQRGQISFQCFPQKGRPLKEIGETLFFLFSFLFLFEEIAFG